MVKIMNSLGLEEPNENPQRWVQAVSIPTAALGILAFFLPWLQLSCGPVGVSLSGYEMATGKANEKLDVGRTQAFYQGLEGKLARSRSQRQTRRPRSSERPQEGPDHEPVTTDKAPLLWIVPIACAAVLLLAFFGLPRLPTIVISLLASGYLAYFWVTGEQASTDPRNTGGVLEFHWLFGFWATWVGLIAPMCVALLKAREDPTGVSRPEFWRPNLQRPSPLGAYEEHRGVLLPREREFTPPDVQKPTDTSPAPAQGSSSVYTYEAPGRPLCPQCGLRPALFYCPAHQAPLCLNCVGSHDVPAECAYVPGWRTEAAFTGESQAPGATYSYEAPGLPLCPQCSLRPALFYCRTHRSSLCLNCIGSHDVPGDCSYDPSWRARKSDGGHSQTWSTSRTARRKTGDVFGIS